MPANAAVFSCVNGDEHQYCDDGRQATLKNPEDNHNSVPYNMEFLTGTGMINAREIVNSYPPVAKAKTKEEASVNFQVSRKVLSSGSLAGLPFFIMSEGSNTHPMEIIELYISSFDVLAFFLGISKLNFGTVKEDYRTWFLLGYQLHYIFTSHERLVFDRSIILQSSRSTSDSLHHDSPKMSQFDLCLRTFFSFQEMKGVIFDINIWMFRHSFERSLKPSKSRSSFHDFPVANVSSLFFEKRSITTVFVFVENKPLLKTFYCLEELDFKVPHSLVRNATESSCDIVGVSFAAITVGGLEECSRKKSAFLVNPYLPYSGRILVKSHSVPFASYRKQNLDLWRVPAVEELHKESNKHEVTHLVSNLDDGIHANEDVFSCLPLYSWIQTKPPSQTDETLNSDAVTPPANPSHNNTDAIHESDLPGTRTLLAESLMSLGELDRYDPNLQRDQNESESCLYIGKEQVTENPSTFSSKSTRLPEKEPERLSLDECYLPYRKKSLSSSECSHGFTENKDDQRENFLSIPEESEKEKLNVAVDSICDSQDLFERDSDSSLGSDCEVQSNAWLEDLVGHQNQVQVCSGACRQSIAGLSPLTSSKKTDAGTQTEDCFGPVLANLGNELAASQNMCSELQQKIKYLEKQLELFEGEKQKLQADLGRYLFLEKKEKRMSAMSVRGHDLLGQIVSGGVTTDYDGSCSFNNIPDSTVSVMNEASKHSKGNSLSWKKTSDLPEHAACSAPDNSVGLQDKHLNDQLNRQDRNGLFFYGTSLPSSSNAELFQANDTTLSEEGADFEHHQCSLLPCNQRSEKTADVAPESGMNAECHLPSSQSAVTANDYPWTSKSFDASVSSNSSQSATNSRISSDNSHNLTCFNENPRLSVGTGVDLKDENVEVPGPRAANGEERVERAVDSFGDASLTALPPGTNTRAVSAANRPSSCERNWERLGARPKQPQHSLAAEKLREPLVSATGGLAADFLARHTQDKALQDSFYQSTGTPSPVFSENSQGTSYVDGYAPEPNRVTACFGGLSFPADTDPHRRKENPFSSVFREEFDRNCIEGGYFHEHLYNNTSDAPDGPFHSPLGEGNLSRFRNCSSRSTTSAVNSHTFQSGFVENSHVLERNNHIEEAQDPSVLPDSCSAFNSEPTNTTQQLWSIPGRVSVVRPSGCMATFEDACLAQGSTHDTSILEPRYGDADSYRSSMLNNRDFSTDSVESSDNSLLALERRVAEASALVERFLREREEREQFGREIERKEQLIREQRAKEKREREERELREAENWPQQQEAITARSQWLCEHYQRHCKVRFPCCTQFYPCHRCHNISKACENEEAKACHATHLKCSHCQEEQQIGEDSAHCRKCGRKMSAYFCAICKHFTSIDKNPYHCDKCGICRIHQDKSFHCEVCNVCLDKRLEGNHKCRPDSGHDECCICLEDAFSGCQILPCSHKVHRECAIAMIQNGIRTCPICRHPLYSQPRE